MFKKLSRRSFSFGSIIEQPTELTTNPEEHPSLPDTQVKNRSRRIRFSKVSGARLFSIPDMPKPKNLMGIPDVTNFQMNEDGQVPREMVPVLTFLAAHASRPYIDGYFMILNELDNNGEPVKERKWTEVFGSLQGTTITMWDAALLDQGIHETSFINVTDCYMRSVESLGPDLQNVIIMSTTMKNRYILQFGTKKLLNEWSAALRLATYERTSLQEAYTGALLYSKGSKMNDIQTILHPLRYKKEFFCNIKFGAGMPWKRVWAVLTPNVAIKDKKVRKEKGTVGIVEFYADKKSGKNKKKPLATLVRAFSAHAVFPEKAALADSSSLLKMECLVEFDDEGDIRESPVFMMPEQKPNQKGYEVLVATLIALYDVFALYGRPKRLNSDKSDLNSLLFALPSLPRIYYLDVSDVNTLSSLSESHDWSNYDWSMRIKETIAAKIAGGFKGTGNLHQLPNYYTSNSGSSIGSKHPSSSNSSNFPVTPDRNATDTPRKILGSRDPSKNPNLRSPSGSSRSDTLASSDSAKLPANYVHPRKAPSPSGTPVVPNVKGKPFELDGKPQQAFGGSSLKNEIEPANKTPAPVEPALTVGDEEGLTLQMPVPEFEKSSAFKTNDQDRPLNPTKPRSSSTNASTSKPEIKDKDNNLLSLPVDVEKRNSGVSLDSFASALDSLSLNNKATSSSSLAPPPADKVKTFEFPSETNELFDLSYRPEHLSYADYSDYMRNYLQNLSSKKPDSMVLDGTSKPKLGSLAEASFKEETMNSVGGSGRPVTPTSTNQRAQLLSTPIRTPEISLNSVPAAEAQQDVTSASAAGGYQNSPGSYALRGSNERKPVGPRPLVGSPTSGEGLSDVSKPTQASSGTATTTFANSTGTSIQPSNGNFSAMLSPRSLTEAKQSASQIPMTFTTQDPVAKSPQLPLGDTSISYYASKTSAPALTAPKSRPMGPKPGPPPMNYPQQSAYAQAAQPSYPPVYGPGYMAQGQAYPPEYFQGFMPMAAGVPTGPVEGYGFPGSYDVPQQGYMVPPSVPYGKSQTGTFDPRSNSNGDLSSKDPASGNKSFNESKAQKLRNVRAQALDGNFGI